MGRTVAITLGFLLLILPAVLVSSWINGAENRLAQTEAPKAPIRKRWPWLRRPTRPTAHLS